MSTADIFIVALLCVAQCGCTVGLADRATASDTADASRPASPSIGLPLAGGDEYLPLGDATLVRPTAAELSSAVSRRWAFQIDVTRVGVVRLEVLDPETNRLLGAVSHRATAIGHRRIEIDKPATLTIATTPGELEIRLNGNAVRRRVGVTLFVAGQSNAANWQCGNCSAAPAVSAPDRIAVLNDPTVHIMPGPAEDILTNVIPPRPLPPLGRAQWVPLTAWPVPYLPIANGRLHAFWPSVADRLIAEFPQLHLAVATVGVGRTAIADWSDATYLYRRFGYLSQIWETDLIIWVQGETDSILATPADVYQTEFDRLRAGIARDFLAGTAAPATRWMLFQTAGIPEDGGGCVEVTTEGRIGIRLAYRRLIASDPAGIVEGVDLDAIPHRCHFDTDGQFDTAVQAIVARLRAYLTTP